MNIVIAQAHGSWEEQNGYVAVPAGTTLHLFQSPGAVMLAKNADWAAFESVETLNDVNKVISTFKVNQSEWITKCTNDATYAENNVGEFPTEDMKLYIQELKEKLERAVIGMTSLADWTLVEDDIIYDYTISSLGLLDAIFGKEAPSDGIKMIRSKMVAEVGDSSTLEFVEPGKDMLLSEVFAKYKGNEIYWLACQKGAAAHPMQEMREMLQQGRVKTAANNFTVPPPGPKPTCAFMDEGQLEQLLGTPRPKTLKEIEDSPYWTRIFETWVDLQDSNVQAAYAEYVDKPNGKARDTLKSAGPNGDLRKDFYDAVGVVKDQLR